MFFTERYDMVQQLAPYGPIHLSHSPFCQGLWTVVRVGFAPKDSISRSMAAENLASWS